MKCPFCNEVIQNKSQFCEKCGKKITVKSKRVKTEKKVHNKNYLEKKHRFHIGKALLTMLLTAVLCVGVSVTLPLIIQKNQTYRFNPLEEITESVIDHITGNKNVIFVPDNMEKMKYLSEGMARDVLQRMKKGEELEIPQDICEIASQFSDIKSGRIERIDYYTNFNEDLLNSIDHTYTVAENDLFTSSLSVVMGKLAGVDSVSFTNSFHMKMLIEKTEQIQNSLWILKYTDSFSMGVIFNISEEDIIVDAYPIAVEDMENYCDMMGLFFSEHEKYT